MQSRLAGFPVLLIANNIYQVDIDTDNSHFYISEFARGNERYLSQNSDLMLGRTIELDLLMRIKASCTQEDFNKILQGLETDNLGIRNTFAQYSNLTTFQA